ncbi:hypothetical protein DY000_02016516 [Brassica cretica]|uniref:Uncharacterized protein n=1 Tax=Brassica cretica TaxID=69181 RepID=A0ABQ7D0Z3_BRACR|nr:hypothetical protein DY000_02016516 [Brassica cretica]
MMASDPKLKAEMDLQEKLLLLPTQRSVHIANLRSLSPYQCSILLTVSFLALEHLRKKIELSTERIHAAKLREDEARKVQESSNTQYARLEELKRRLETVAHQQQPMLIRLTRKKTEGKEEGGKEHGQRPATAEGESKSRKKPQIQGRGRGIGIMNNKGRGGWTGAGFDVDVRT